MKAYTKIDVPEWQLEEVVRQNPGLIEEGLRYVDHQRPAAGGRLDVLLLDSGRSLVVAELKVVQDDGMLLQGLDYYDFISANVETIARVYKDLSIDPTQQVRLLLIAPEFSQILVNRCKWLTVPVSLFTFSCLKFEDGEIVPVFMERAVPVPSEPPGVHTLEEILSYITDPNVRSEADSLLKELKSWKPESVSLDPIQDCISMKVNNRAFAYFYPRRKFYVISVYDPDQYWPGFTIKTEEDLQKVRPAIQVAMHKRAGLAAGAGN